METTELNGIQGVHHVSVETDGAELNMCHSFRLDRTFPESAWLGLLLLPRADLFVSAAQNIHVNTINLHAA